jgi:tetratricopeptide (TPR) repeat protein/CHAT domain-containing protein
MQEATSLTLEILKLPDALKMSIFEQHDLASTIRHYSSQNISIPQINSLCQELSLILEKAEKSGNLESQDTRDFKKIAQLLWDHLFTRTIKDKLSSSEPCGLVFSLDEELISIPWELIFTGTDFLCLKFNVGRIVRTKEQGVSPHYRSFSANLKMLVLANPTNDLKSSYQEGLAIRNQFDRITPRVKVDFKSTDIDTVYVKKNLRDYDIVHFAGHCEFDPEDTKMSGWVLSDGKLSAQDIANLSGSLSLPTLVFSNACTSAGLNYQEGAYSLAAAFLFSGVRHYIGSIRKINDPVSLTFAKEFYMNLVSGRQVGESLRLARLKVIKEHGLGAIDWASYLLYGDPNFSLIRKELLAPARKNITFNKSWIAGFLLIILAGVISIGAYTWIPMINPTTRLLFLKAQRLSEKGLNQEAASVAQKIIKDNERFMVAYPLLAESYRKQGLTSEALQVYFQFAMAAEKVNDTPSLAAAYIGIGRLYQLAGALNKASDFYNRALAVSEENKDMLHTAMSLRKLALLAMERDDYASALELLTKSSAINSRYQNNPEHNYNLACDYFDIALVLFDRKDYRGAEEFYNRSRVIFEKLKLKNELSDYYFNLGELYLAQKQYQMALDCYLKGLKIDRDHGNKPSIAADYNMLGELYVAMDDSVKAQDYFSQALTLAKDIKAMPELASAYYNLGILYRSQGRKNLAREYLREAQAIYATLGLADYEKVKKEIMELN